MVCFCGETLWNNKLVGPPETGADIHDKKPEAGGIYVGRVTNKPVLTDVKVVSLLLGLVFLGDCYVMIYGGSLSFYKSTLGRWLLVICHRPISVPSNVIS